MDWEVKREYNAIIAERILCTPVRRNKKGGWSLGPGEYYDDHGALELLNELPNYFDDIAAAWDVVEQLKTTMCELQVSFSNTKYYATFVTAGVVDESHPLFHGEGETASEAICKAALRSVGVEVI